MDIISSRSKESARAALNVKEGALSRRINQLKDQLSDIAAHLNAWADYPEEDIPAVENDALSDSLKNIETRLNEILSNYDNGRILKDGIDAVIAGKPNVGKSTLMNLLAGYDKSIVTSVAGTTRDIVEESVSLGDIVLNLSDTAGIHETGDEIESIGVDKARSRVSSAALLLCVFDASSPLDDDDRDMIRLANDIPSVAILNKCDLPELIDDQIISDHFDEVVRMSAKFDESADALVQAIKRVCVVSDINSTNALMYNERQRTLTMKAANCVHEAVEALHIGFTLDAVTVLIEEAIGYLCELTGERVTDEVIDKVFHRFCVGK